MKQPKICDVLGKPSQILNLELLWYIAQGEKSKIEKVDKKLEMLFTGVEQQTLPPQHILRHTTTTHNHLCSKLLLVHFFLLDSSGRPSQAMRFFSSSTSGPRPQAALARSCGFFSPSAWNRWTKKMKADVGFEPRPPGQESCASTLHHSTGCDSGTTIMIYI